MAKATRTKHGNRFIICASSILSGAVLAAMSFMSVAQSAWDFVPSPSEYQAWPEYCRVQFTLHGDVFRVPNGIRYPAATVETWRKVIGQPFEGLHHYCASIHFLGRSRTASDSNTRGFLLNRALADAVYSFAPADRSSAVYPEIAVTLAQIKVELNALVDAADILQGAIESQSSRLEPYVMLALVQRKQGKLELARETLHEADEMSGGESAEVQYNLGLINLDLGDLDAAVENARRVYAADYPLPGLKRRLEKLGRWNKSGT